MLHDIVDAAAYETPDAPASWADGTWRTFAELRARTERVAGAMQLLGGPGDRIAMVADNCQAWIDCYYGVPRAGMMLTPINQRLTPNEQAELLDRVEPVAVIGGPHATIDLDDWETILAGAPRPASIVGQTDTDPAWLLFTSGTTGRPKGAVLSHRSIATAVKATAWGRPIAEHDVFLTAFPLCHVAGYGLLVFHSKGRPGGVLRRFRADEFAATVRELGVTSASMAPTMIVALLDHLDETDSDLPTLGRILYGAAPIPPTVRERAAKKLGVTFTEGYGMTELSGTALFDGRPSPWVEVQLGPGDEVLVRGDQVTVGYWRDDEATAEAFDADGWFHTGDIGAQDDEGNIRIVDRAKDVIITGGENVASREVEDVLHEHPAIAAAAVVGVPDDYWGEAICAVVVRRAELTEDEVIEHVRTRLASFKKPRRVVFVDALPVNAAGKVLKSELRAIVS